MTEHVQDWNVTVINKKSSDAGSMNKQKVTLSESHTKLVKVVENTGDDSFHHEQVSYSLKMKIQRARNENKLTQRQLAEKIGVTSKVINEYESGKAIPNKQILTKMSRILGVILTNK